MLHNINNPLMFSSLSMLAQLPHLHELSASPRAGDGV